MAQDSHPGYEPLETRRRQPKRWLRFTLIGIAVLLVLLAAAFLAYVSSYYHTDPETAAAIAADGNIRRTGQLVIIEPPAGEQTESGLVFYPGGKVEATAYVPLLKRIARGGVTCVLVEMPFNLAVFDANAAEQAFAALPGITRWHVGGHSLGGAMASRFLASNPDRAIGLVLLGAAIYGDVPPARTLTLVGSEDRVLDRGAIAYTENVIEIQGGNHARFGNYGEQSGDGTATIDRETQQAMAAEAILAFMGRSR